ncbi:MAG: InlB B-repeat-containing protein [Sphaerochaetaceae bacterium]|nr:InlB B-repeat-containing protein [Sphaerochaetaceae bacterium]MDD3163961.1 InlB B-repeat-containing protein [Sphaerochaetaceae bacterium]MDD4008048.1 InlB B-repeat-containing protein [Sphaerochaetaceae bacterium]
MRKYYRLVIIVLVALALTSCASFKEFSAEYDRIAPYMLKNGTSISTDDMKADWIIGSWSYDEFIQHSTSQEGIAITEDPPVQSQASVDIFAGGRTDQIDLAGLFGRTDEKHQISVYDLKVSTDHRTVVMTKIESETLSDGITKDSFIYVRMLTKKASAITFTITFNADGGTPTASQTVALGESVSKVNQPEKAGFNFTGWSKDGALYDFTSAVSSDVSLKAGWEVAKPKEFSVSFNAAGGTETASQTVVAGSAAVAPASPDKAGFIFGGWMLGDALYDFASPVNADTVLNAKWDTKVETYAPNFFDTKFFYSQCKDVQWYTSGGELHVSGPAPLYNASTGSQLSEDDLSGGAYIRFAKTEENGLYSQTLYAKDGTVKAVLSVKGRIAYFGDYGFLYKADAEANNAYTEFCSYFYTNKGLNPDGSTPSSSSFAYTIEEVTDDAVLENFGK